MSKWICVVSLAALMLVGCGEKGEYATIGTGGVTGVYYPAGGAMAKLANRNRVEGGTRFAVESTAGSVYNINAVLAGDLQFGIAQSDRQYQAVNGLAEWKDRGKQSDLRAVCSLHPETVTLVAADDANIRKLADLRGKRVSIGNPGSGNRGNALDVLKAAGIDWKTDIKAEELDAKVMASSLNDGRIDAFFYTVGHPNSSIMEATAGRRKIRFVPITGMDTLIAASPYYAKATIPADFYPAAANTNKTVETIGMMTTVVTSAKVKDDVVYALTKAVFENLDELRKQHPAFKHLTKEGMLKGLSAPIHPGAMKYFKEAGLK